MVSKTTKRYQEYLNKGLYQSFDEFVRFKRRKIVLATLASLVLCSSILGAIKARESLLEMVTKAHLFPSYEKVVIQAMNGDARFAVGNELFECRGGYLGSIR